MFSNAKNFLIERNVTFVQTAARSVSRLVTLFKFKRGGVRSRARVRLCASDYRDIRQ